MSPRSKDIQPNDSQSETAAEANYKFDAAAPLILASASPRRRELLANAGVNFEIQVSQVEEVVRPGEAPEDLVRRLAVEKACDVARRLPDAAARWVLGADTIVVIDGCILGKPRDPEDAVRLLKQILGRTHRVLTGVALVSSHAAKRSTAQVKGAQVKDDQDEILCTVVESHVQMRSADEAEIRAYVATGEPLDKAGAYALQGEGRKFVERVEGSQTNVIGLPMEVTLSLLHRQGLAAQPQLTSTQNCKPCSTPTNPTQATRSAATEIASQLAAIQQRITAACVRAGRNPSAVTLIAVCKKQPLTAILDAARAGQRDFAENYVQEARRKIAAASEAQRAAGDETKMRWHCIGNLQSKKAKEAVQLFDVLHTVDRISLALELEKHAAALQKILPIYLQVNLSEEPQKSGASVPELLALAQACQKLPHLRVEGLMTIPAYSDDPEASRPIFRRLRELRDELERSLGQPLPGLSMGMSGDFEVAVEEGATIVRIGTALFGARDATPTLGEQ